MMKKLIKIGLLLIFCLVLTGCDELDAFMNNNKNKVVVTFDANNGDPDGIETFTVTIGTTVENPGTPYNEYYNFDGWYNNDEKWDLENDLVTSSMTLQAHWVKKKYILTIRYNDGVTEDIVKEYEYGGKIDLDLEEPVREGYTLLNWYIPETMPGCDYVVNAEWIENQYKLTIKYNDGVREDDEVMIRYNDTIHEIYSIEREGYKLTTDLSEYETMPAHDIVINCEWEIKKCELKIRTDNGSEDLVIIQDYGTPINLVSDPTKEFYTFIGWSEPIPITMPDGFTEIFAKWKPNQYTLTIKNYYGDSDLIITQDYYSEIQVEDPTRLGYRFISYSEELPRIMLGEDKTIEAIWRCHVSYKIENEEVTITDYSDREEYIVTEINNSQYTQYYGATDLVILDSYEGYPVTKIAPSAFYEGYGIKSIQLPNTISSIGKSAFEKCGDMEKINLPNNLTSIEDSTFKNCTYLREITIPNTITKIGNHAFESCIFMQTISIPDSVLEIGEGAFAYCNSLTSIKLSNNITTIPKQLLFSCSSLTNLVIPEKVATIGSYAFNLCNKLETISIPNSINEIGLFAFNGCSSLKYNELDNAYYLGNDNNPYVILVKAKDTLLTSCTISENTKSILPNAFKDCVELLNIKIPDSILEVGQYAFYNCTKLETVTLSQNLKWIERYAFSNCTSLKNIVIPTGMTSINSYAFSNCTSLTSIVVPDSVTEIANGAFKNCTSLESITLPFIGNDRDGTLSTYFGYIFGEYDYSGKIPSTLNTVIITDQNKVPNLAFCGCTQLVTIELPDSITSISSNAFSGCDNLIYNELDNALYMGNKTNPYLILVKAKDVEITSCNINENTKFILATAFENCCELKEVKMPTGLLAIDTRAFFNCNLLTSIEIPSTITSIGENAFPENGQLQYNEYSNSYYLGNNENPYLVLVRANQELTTCEINANTKIIMKYAFQNCTSLMGIEIPSSVASIGSYAFSNCTSLESVTIQNGVINIGNGVFSECDKLKKLEIPSSVTGIGSYAFSDCTSLESVTIPNGVISIGNGMFSGCKSLLTIVIPSSVTSIGSYVFSGCDKLKNLEIPSGITIIENNTFSNCTALTTITIPTSVKTIQGNSFSGCTSLTTIIYQGTIEEWHYIYKDDAWNNNTGTYRVQCTDGTINKE